MDRPEKRARQEKRAHSASLEDANEGDEEHAANLASVEAGMDLQPSHEASELHVAPTVNHPSADNSNDVSQVQPGLAEVLADALGNEGPKVDASQASKPKSRKTGPRPKTAREVRKRDQERELEKTKAKKAKTAAKADGAGVGRTIKPTKAPKAPKGSSSKTGKRPPKKKGLGGTTQDAVERLAKIAPGKGRARRKKTFDTGQHLLGLLYSDTIRDRISLGDIGQAPEISSTKSKAGMLSELVASVPDDVNKKLVTNDRAVLLKASKNFGVGRVTGKEGKWLLKGMKTPLLHHQLLGTDWMASYHFLPRWHHTER